MSQFVGASDHRLFADWQLWLNEPSHVWSCEWQTLAARGVSLVCNDPFAAAMVNAKIRETHGPRGMMLRSGYSETGGVITSAGERDKRRQIEWIIERGSYGTALDAGGTLTRLELDRSLDWIATVMGDAWAVWVVKPGRPGASLAGCWRIITPDRVTNPDDRPDDNRLQRGCELDEDGALVAIHVQVGNVGPFGVIESREWRRIPIYNEKTGMRQVTHRTGLKLPGMLRGVSMFAPALLLMRQIQGTVEAHVAGKRAQAIHPIVYFTDDEEELKAAVTAKAKLGPNAVLGPMSILVAKYGATDVKFMQSNFQGSDLKEFLTTMYRSLTAMWGFPWQVVLAEMGEASLSSARAGLDQADRTAETYGIEHEHQVSRIMDEAMIREAEARGDIDLGTDIDWPTVMAGRYSRPPKYSTDRQKDANTIATLVTKARVSPTTALGMFGLNYEDEAEQTARDREFAAGQGLPDPTQDSAPASAPGQPPAPIDGEGDDAPADEDQTSESNNEAVTNGK
jgi:capsid protein